MANAKFRSSQLLGLVDSDSDDGLSGRLTRPAKPTKSANNKTNKTNLDKSKGNKISNNKPDKMPPAKKANAGTRGRAANKVTKPAQKTSRAANERIIAAAEDQIDEEDSRTLPLVEKSTNAPPKKPTGRGRKRAASEEEPAAEDVEMEDAPAPAPAPKASRGRPKRAAIDEVPDSQPPPPPKRGRKKAKQPELVVEEPEEIEETTEIPETQQPNLTIIEEEDAQEQLEELLYARKSSSLEPSRSKHHPGSAVPPSPAKSRPALYGSASPTKTSTSSSAEVAQLRRRLGEMTQKYANLDGKYQSLREIALREAESNFELLKKQTDEKFNAADELISSLKAEVAAQKEASRELTRLQKQLEASESKIATLETKNAELSTALAESKTEIKALNMKLTAARTAEAAAAAKAAVPGSAVKGASSRLNNHMMTTSNSEAVRQATLKGQKREDLYADLTGLIIRTIPGSSANGTKGGKDSEGGPGGEDVIYDCIQTGKNGTLHFKLLEIDDPEVAGEEPQLRYMPQLDSDRDRGLMEILPNFLVDEIEFPRSHVDKFYARVVKALTGA